MPRARNSALPRRRWPYMVLRLFLVYVLVELAVVVALVSTIGFGWTLLALLATFAGGVALAGSQARRQLARLQSGSATRQGALADSALVALGSSLVVIPGLVTSAAGLLLLLPFTRAAARPVMTAFGMRTISAPSPLFTVTTMGAHRYGAERAAGRGDYIDGEVIDVTEVEPPSLRDGSG